MDIRQVTETIAMIEEQNFNIRAFVQASCSDAASTRWAGLWPDVEQ